MSTISLRPLDLTSDDFRDRVNGCWMGKNCGGTLGAPLEKAFGEPEPLDVWWYPRLEEGGIPNDDLELQLFWLKALEEVGPGLRAADLAKYWLDHIRYNPDEYGMCKTNLRLGLLPPVCGSYNNHFKDCMGCPIRSEIWACVAPGAPRVACIYAYEDGIVDHAGGESLYGEFFNTAVESAAFVISHRDTLIDIGMSYVPEGTKTFLALRAALDAHAAGVDWLEARRRVLAAAPHFNAQYSPLNLGFQLIGWLYGDDFGDTICKAVNCGYDTDCTGATVGSILGILLGRSGLPTKWTEPLGETIATSEKNGGVTYASTGPNPVPADLGELTERTIKQAARVLAWHGVTPGKVAVEEMYADERLLAAATSAPMKVIFPATVSGASLEVAVDYGDSPVIAVATKKKVVTSLKNSRSGPLHAHCVLEVPAGWTVSPEQTSVEVAAGTEKEITWELSVAQAAQLAPVNNAWLQVVAANSPIQPATPVTLLGAIRYRRTDIYPLEGKTEVETLRAEMPAEKSSSDVLTPEGRAGKWREFDACENELPLGDVFDKPGVMYVQSFVWSPVARDQAWSGVSSTCPARMWVNGELKAECADYKPFRPAQCWSNTPEMAYEFIALKKGWNEVLFKFVRGQDAPPFRAAVTFAEDKPWFDVLIDLVRTRFPWEA